jgi:hypothetical protein
MIRAGHSAGLRELQPADPPGGSRRPRGAGLYVRLLAAHGLVDLATSLLKAVGWAHRAGHVGLAYVEYSVRISARLRGWACRLIGPRARGAS